MKKTVEKPRLLFQKIQNEKWPSLAEILRWTSQKR
jgi:hypothetical protein